MTRCDDWLAVTSELWTAELTAELVTGETGLACACCVLLSHACREMSSPMFISVYRINTAGRGGQWKKI